MATLLLKSISEGRLRQTGLLLKVGKDVNELDSERQTGLMKAMAINNAYVRMSMVKVILNYSADVTLVDLKKRNAFMWACYYGRADQIKFFASEFDVNTLQIDRQDKDGNTSLMLAVKQGHLETVIELVKVLKDSGMQSVLSMKNHVGLSPLMEAFRMGNFEIAKHLINEGKVSIDNLTNIVMYNDQFRLDWTTRLPQEMMKHVVENLDDREDPHPSNILKLLITNDSFRTVALKSYNNEKKMKTEKGYQQPVPRTAPGKLQTGGQRPAKAEPKQKSIKGMLPTIMNLYEEQHSQNYRPASKNNFIPYSSVSRQLRSMASRTSSTTGRVTRSHLASLPDFSRFSRFSEGKFTRSNRSTSVQLPQLNSWSLLRRKLRSNFINDV